MYVRKKKRKSGTYIQNVFLPYGMKNDDDQEVEENNTSIFPAICVQNGSIIKGFSIRSNLRTCIVA